MSRIPQYNYPSVQIDSFPGAQIHHLKGVLGKLHPCAATQKVILSVGLNNCLRENQIETIIKQFQQLIVLVRRIFPHAQVFVPLIQFSTKLPPKVQSLIEQTNIFIKQYLRTLNVVEECLFGVQPHDPVHWMAKTATNILDAWMKQLN